MHIPRGVHARAKEIDLLAVDGDGVLFPNDAFEALTIGGVSLKPKLRSHYDGQGLSFLRAIGVKVCVITNAEGEDGRAARELVDRWNNLPSCKEGKFAKVELFSGYDGRQKVKALSEWLAVQAVDVKSHIGLTARCAVMGNDIGDYHMLGFVRDGLPACPCDAEGKIKEVCEYITPRPGGHGAVRDLCNLILAAKGIDPTELPLK